MRGFAVPPPQTAGRFLRRFCLGHIGQLNKALRQVLHRALSLVGLGEAVTLDPPLRFRIKPGALRVRIAHQHPGVSPSAAIPASYWGGIRALADMAAGRTPRTKES